MEQKKLKRKVDQRFLTVAVVLLAALVLLGISRLSVSISNWYAGAIYPLFVNSIGRFFSIFPFSFIEILIYLHIIGFVLFFVHFVRRMVKNRRMLKLEFLNGISKILFFIVTLFLVYVLACGINYQRRPFSEVSELAIADSYTADELGMLAVRLTEHVNDLSRAVERDQDGISILPKDPQKKAVDAMKKLGDEYTSLAGYYPRPKEVLVSEVLSYQNLSGIYMPFTIEANYNGSMVSYNIPHTACHELSHLKGFMKEEEANYIAYLACIGSEEPMFQYSGYLTAWIYTMNALKKADPGQYETVRALLYQDVLADLRANSEFWENYDGKTAKMANKINDTYLKANAQEDGVKSYGRMVDLLVSEYLKETGDSL